jgi:hypothetical protein
MVFKVRLLSLMVTGVSKNADCNVRMRGKTEIGGVLQAQIERFS